jgi:N-acetylneuraminate synthase/sialic acid synthase
MTRELVIDGTRIADDTDCFVIAEIGHNHQGDVDHCKRLFDAAHDAGASAVKLQKRDNRALFTREAFDAPYNSENAYGPTYGTHREALEFDRDQYLELQQHAKDLGITFFATAFDIESADLLAELDMPAYKLASGDLRSIPLLTHVARIGKPMILSTGAATLEDVRRAYDAVAPINPQLAFLQCTAAYPPDYEELDLRVIDTYRREFPDVVAGFSGHDSGIAMSTAAFTLGARVVEKHFTLNRALRGTDHAFSLEPVGLKKLVRDLQRTRLALGDGAKKFYDSEVAPSQKMGKKLVAARPLAAGTVLTVDDIAMKSPGDALFPYHLDDLLGRRLTVDLDEDEALTFDHVGGPTSP